MRARKPLRPGALDALKKEMQFEYSLVKAGGHLIAGVDPTGNGSVMAGFGDLRNLELLVEAEFTRVQAGKIVTWGGAKFLHQEDRAGSVAVGKRADLVVIRVKSGGPKFPMSTT